MDHSPDVHFYRMFLHGRPPRPAPRDAAGFLPHRAAQFCEPVALAAGFGWWLFAPVDCQVKWDGTTMHASIEDGPWEPIDDTLSFPGWPQDFYATAPEPANQVPPAAFLTAIPEPGILQINTGIMARCAPGYGLMIRRPVNFPTAGGLDYFEGILNPNVWFGPLFLNVRITKTDLPIRLHPDRPLLNISAIPFDLMRGDATVAGVHDMGADEWRDYAGSFVDSALRPDRPYGEYAALARKDQRSYGFHGCPVNHAVGDVSGDH